MCGKTLLVSIFAWVLFLTIASAYTWKGVDFHGFMDQGYMSSDANNYLGGTKAGTFRFADAAFNASTQLNDKLRIGGQLFTYRLGVLGGLNRPMIDWLYADYQWQPYLGFRMGKVKSPTGIYSESIDLAMTRPYVFLPSGVYSPLLRSLDTALWGGSLYGDISLKKYGSLEYTLTMGMPDFPTHNAISWSFSESGIFNIDHVCDNFAINGQLVWSTPVSGLKIAGSLFYTPNLTMSGAFKSAAKISFLPAPANALAGLAGVIEGSNTEAKMSNAFITTIGVEYLWKEWTFATEYQRMNYRTVLTVHNAAADSIDSLNGSVSEGTARDSIYFSAARRITKQLELGGYYSLIFTNLHDRNGSARAAAGDHGYNGFQKDLAGVACYQVTPYWLIKAEGHIMNGTDVLANISENQPWSNTDRYWLLGIIQTTLFF